MIYLFEVSANFTFIFVLLKVSMLKICVRSDLMSYFDFDFICIESAQPSNVNYRFFF